MNWLTPILCAVLLAMSWQLWREPGTGIQEVRGLERAIVEQRRENAQLDERNKALEGEVASLRQDLAAIEERARVELGMIGRDETFFHVLESAPSTLQ